MIGAARIEGIDGVALSFSGEVLTLGLSRAFAPGTPIRGSITIGDAQVAIDARVNTSKRQADGTFEVRARLVSVTRDARQKLEGAAR